MLKQRLVRGIGLTLAMLLVGVAARYQWQLREEQRLLHEAVEASDSLPVNAEQGERQSRESLTETDHYPNLYASGRIERTELPEKVVFLTFDDGPSQNTEKILDSLSEYGAKATFFLVGENMTESGIAIAKRAVAEGHMLGMHTESHRYDRIYASVDAFLKDYDELASRFRSEFAECPAIFRFPGGSYSSYINPIREPLREELAARGFLGYDWDVSGEDAVGTPTAASIKRNIFDAIYLREEPIVLLHDAPGCCLTAEVLPEILSRLSKEGYTFLTLRHREPYQFPW